MKKQTNPSGQVLVGVLLAMVVLVTIIPALVQWVRQDVRTSTDIRKSSNAFSLAQAAVDRGYWKVKSSTATAAWALAGIPIAGYQFDTTYTDVIGGVYRIKLSTASGNSVLITGEGKDLSTNQVRAISALYKNQSVYSPALAKGTLTWGPGLGIFWGPIMSQGDIALNSDIVANMYYPRKFSKGVVTGTAANPRDINGLLPPNTDGIEWWSGTDLVPELPVLDFAALRSSAAATSTLNVYGCRSTGAAWDGRGSCTNTGAHASHFSASYNYVPAGWVAGMGRGAKADPNNSYVWYYDGDVILGGDTAVNIPNGNATYGVGLRGTLIVRGNLTLDANGDYNYTGPIPANAWKEFGKLTKTTFDTTAVNEYPGDTGLRSSAATWSFGSSVFPVPGAGSGYVNTVGIRGFVYVGGNLTVTNNGFMDINGSLWVNGNTIATGATNTTFCGIWFDENLSLPTLNVILIQQSFQEVGPSSAVWN